METEELIRRLNYLKEFCLAFDLGGEIKNREITEEFFREIHSRITLGPSVTRAEIELEALKTERDGYQTENSIRISHGQALAYGSDSFFEIAERMRKIEVDK